MALLALSGLGFFFVNLGELLRLLHHLVFLVLASTKIHTQEGGRDCSGIWTTQTRLGHTSLVLLIIHPVYGVICPPPPMVSSTSKWLIYANV
jgi:hypothetical protein